MADDDIDMNVRVANTAQRENVAIRRGLHKDFDDAPEVSAELFFLLSSGKTMIIDKQTLGGPGR